MAETTTLARPYARAAFEVALAGKTLQSWSEMLAQVQAVARHDAVVGILSSPSLTGAAQAQILLDLCGDSLDPALQNFIRILAENKRLPLLEEIATLFEEMKAVQEKTLDVDVTTAFPLADSTRQKLAEALGRRLQRTVTIRSEVDKNLIGGIVVRAGDLVIDGSLRGRLNKLTEAMNS
ncbi:MAG: F0F1 ATP synthase subunit delta [Pseudomonadales bacterium]|nr:F0F1 ATP synthase subunit delta [Pseudomonadales bacterium]